MTMALQDMRALAQIGWSGLDFFLHASPRPDVIRGLPFWKWLWSQKRMGNYIDRSVQLRGEGNILQRIQLNKGTAIDRGCTIWLGSTSATIVIESNCYIGPYSYLGSTCTLSIEEGTLIGAGSYLITANHRFDDPESALNLQGYSHGKISIGRNAWLGAHVVVLPGVSIGDGAVIGAGAVVNRNVPAGEVWGGVPARLLKKGNSK